MTCCGGTIKRAAAVAGKVGQIAAGAVLEKVDDVFGLPTERHHMVEVRKTICRTCPMHTWMTEGEFWAWVDGHGGRVKFMADLADLNGWELLPAQDYARGRLLMCRVCKCWLGRKAQLKDAECSMGLWPAD